MAQLKVLMTLETDEPEKLASILSHHADYIIDFDNNQDVIKSIESVKTYEIGKKRDVTKLQILSDIIEDILPDGELPDRDELNNDDNIYEMYEHVGILQRHLSENGY